MDDETGKSTTEDKLTVSKLNIFQKIAANLQCVSAKFSATFADVESTPVK